jgi:hypothetical protein
MTSAFRAAGEAAAQTRCGGIQRNNAPARQWNVDIAKTSEISFHPRSQREACHGGQIQIVHEFP